MANEDNSSVVRKEFFSNNYRLAYTHYYHLREAAQNQPSAKQIIVNNILCQREGQCFKKITEIKVGRQTIVLQDYYSFFELTTPTEQIPSIKNCNSDVFSTQSLNQIGYAQEKKYRVDKKNIIKNIIKAYLSWLRLQSQQSQQFKATTNHLEMLMKKYKFNNNLIQRVIADNITRCLFQDFLATSAVSWISNSKIHDKTSHLEAIQKYGQECRLQTLSNI